MSTMSLNPKINAVNSIAQRQPDSPLGNSLRNIATQLADAAENLVQERRNPDASRSDAFNAAASATATDLYRKRVEKAQVDFNETINRLRTDASTGQDKQAALVPDQYASETRGIFRELDEGAKAVFIGDAIERKDAPTVAAVTEVPPHLAGLSSEQQGQFRDAFLDKHAKSSDITEIDEIADSAKAIFSTLLTV